MFTDERNRPDSDHQKKRNFDLRFPIKFSAVGGEVEFNKLVDLLDSDPDNAEDPWSEIIKFTHADESTVEGRTVEDNDHYVTKMLRRAGYTDVKAEEIQAESKVERAINALFLGF